MALSATKTKAAEIRERVGHPIVDGDGHMLPLLPIALDYVREELGSKTFERYQQQTGALPHHGLGYMKPMSIEERRDIRKHQGTWSGNGSSNVLDFATAFLPKLLSERMDDIGFDYTILYGTYITQFASAHDEDIRIGGSRAINRFYAETYNAYASQMAPAAIIPMHKPEEAIAELEHAKQLGLKAVAFPVGVQRPIPYFHRKYPELFPRLHWWDTYGLDSEYDYDPVWAKCVELGYAATFHGGAGIATSILTSRSITNATYNHIGAHALLQHQLCKSLFLGGVTRRFPNLTFGFLECGAAWACQLLANFEEYWEKRNLGAMDKRDLQNLDRDRFRQLLSQWGEGLVDGNMDLGWLDVFGAGWPDSPPENRDEWRFVDVKEEHEIADLFVPNFYFGCEADDPSSAYCFSPANAFGAELKPILSSDIGHWDVLEMEGVLPDSYKMLERGVITPEQYRKFTFENPAMLHLRMNPSFFDGTKFEREARSLLAQRAN